MGFIGCRKEVMIIDCGGINVVGMKGYFKINNN